MIEDAKAHADELVSQTTVLARAQTQAAELLENANQHVNALRQQTQHDLSNMLDQVNGSISAKLEDLRIMKQNISSLQMFSGSDENN